ncbi:hypothetical protein ACF0H5_023501 [Mactra antiquata]
MVLIGPWSDLPRVKKWTQGRSDDWADRMNHIYTVFILLCMAVLVTTAQFVGSRIQCWTPAEFTEGYEDYVHHYCWIKNTYFVPAMDPVSPNVQAHQEAEIAYYQWVPMFILIQVFLFKFPNVLWEIFHSRSGLRLGQIIKYADWAHYNSQDDRKELIQNLSSTLDKWLATQRQYQHTVFNRILARFSRIVCLICNKREGNCLTALYMCTKVLYLLNIIGQFFLLDAFLYSDYSNIGFEWIKMMRLGQIMRESPRFPRITLCDFKIRILQNVKDYTLQCVLPINLFNEKLFLILWFWLVIMAFICFYSICKWIYLIVVKRNNYQYVKKYLKITEQLGPHDKVLCKSFADDYLRDDGCFVLRMIGMNTSDLVTADLLDCLFVHYRMKTQSKETNNSTETISAPYVDDAEDSSLVEKEQ